MSITKLETIQFHNQQLIVLNHQNKPYVAMKPVCENIGLDWAAQLKRIKRHQVLRVGMVIMTTPSKQGLQEYVCLPISMINGWLFGIETSRVKPEIRATLEQYQLECFDVLYSHFMPKVAQQHPNTISLEQQQAIQQAVNERVYRTGERHQAVYSKFHQQFKIPRYQDLPASKFDEAIKWLGGITMRDYKVVNIDNLKRQYNYIATIQEYYYRVVDLYNDCFADFLNKNSPHLHYNFSTALNKIQVNLGLSMNFVRSELDICNAKKTLV
ncbi:MULTISPECIES: phage antirepressor N-terminal domain-containing protein [unclassified Gilliamella]|uniref:phage antirepressor N-terminal domain-containing protein n=1 Tax=unclassified Gilliamella TaxID=2685620 RepID=UPI00226AB1DB|nr:MULTISPECIES: phage antirepressor N-terminal domain-containing protein [unclassified Gilliamella]MCX8602606.1 ORF6C domain-containing protein [Gilliamella sp. B3722]MCX8607782.1 ORF6C domain-containing protein [Gilliamella sp. B3771]MCX8611836.1 ORF6C domain-containing protein [Gilliamella sp. B3891]MCX8614289.1 ORF6C domain-containing protein [Gilliamella sp. B3773]MCX8615971.1 ORF6C domain-containing protein [Gilliamella sp. B3770]